MLKVTARSPGLSARNTIEPSALRKATCLSGESPDEVESMRSAPGATNLLAWASAVKSTVGMTTVGDLEWSMVTTPRQVVHPLRWGAWFWTNARFHRRQVCAQLRVD